MNDEPGFAIEVYGDDDQNLLDHHADRFVIQVYQHDGGKLRPAIKIDCIRREDGTLVASVQDWSRNEFGRIVSSAQPRRINDRQVHPER